MTITKASAKAKARNCQNWVAQKVAAILNVKCGKDEPVAPREMGQSGVDIRIVGVRLRQRFPWSIECRWRETWNVLQMIEQAKKNQIGGTDWLVIAKKSRVEPVAILDASVFFNILDQLYNRGRCSDVTKG